MPPGDGGARRLPADPYAGFRELYAAECGATAVSAGGAADAVVYGVEGGDESDGGGGVGVLSSLLSPLAGEQSLIALALGKISSTLTCWFTLFWVLVWISGEG